MKKSAKKNLAARGPAPGLEEGYALYFGRKKGGVDLAASVLRLPLEGLEAFVGELRRSLGGRGRVFLMGNGGSYDNALLLGQMMRRAGLRASTPGHPEDYLPDAMRTSYAEIYRLALKHESPDRRDLVIGISGSGNSENILRALEYGRDRGARIFCLGGRDGGKMARLCGKTRSLIAANDCMEAIEDLHLIAGLAALRMLGSSSKPISVLRRLSSSCLALAGRANLRLMGRMAASILETGRDRGRVFILGVGIAANHFRADLQRGATNSIPMRGISAPECFTVNSSQATANDDGLDFVLADGLVKHDPGKKDFALLLETRESEPLLRHCRDLLDGCGTPRLGLGKKGIRLDLFNASEREAAVGMVGHATGQVLCDHLRRSWKIRKLDLPPLSGGVKKLGRDQCLRLEKKLRKSGKLLASEHLSFCYGSLFAATPPKGHGLARCFY